MEMKSITIAMFNIRLAEGAEGQHFSALAFTLKCCLLYLCVICIYKHQNRSRILQRNVTKKTKAFQSSLCTFCGISNTLSFPHFWYFRYDTQAGNVIVKLPSSQLSLNLLCKYPKLTLKTQIPGCNVLFFEKCTDVYSLQDN